MARSRVWPAAGTKRVSSMAATARLRSVSSPLEGEVPPEAAEVRVDVADFLWEEP